MQTDTVGDGATAAGGGLESLTYANTAVVVTDLDRAIQWYGRHLGFTERARACASPGRTSHCSRAPAPNWNSCSTTTEA